MIETITEVVLITGGIYLVYLYKKNGIDLYTFGESLDLYRDKKRKDIGKLCTGKSISGTLPFMSESGEK